jgi:hypothetical protein
MILRERVRREPAAKHADGWRPSFRELPPVSGLSSAAIARDADDRGAHVSLLHPPLADLSTAG